MISFTIGRLTLGWYDVYEKIFFIHHIDFCQEDREVDVFIFCISNNLVISLGFVNTTLS